MATLWSHTGPMKERDARRLLTVLERRALVNLDREAAEVGDDPKRRVSLHDLIYDYATRLASDRVALHQRVLDAYSRRCPEGWPSGPNDGYFFQHLRHHLAEAGRDTEMTRLLLDLRWLEAKAEAGLVFDLAMDFTWAGERIPIDHARPTPLTADRAGPPLRPPLPGSPSHRAVPVPVEPVLVVRLS